MRKTRAKGFTLIELMIVVAIIGILAAVAIPKFADAMEKANLGATLGNIAAIRSAISIYYTSYAKVPDSLDTKTDTFQPIMAELPGVKCHYPLNHSPYGNSVSLGTTVPDSSGNGWYYDYALGNIYINSVEKDLYNINYTTY